MDPISSTSTANAKQQQQEPGLMAGHAEYAKGAAQAAVGSLTGSHAWTKSGEQAKAHGVATMKAASEARDAEGGSKGFGKAEEVAGKAVGCEGMRREGAESQGQH